MARKSGGQPKTMLSNERCKWQGTFTTSLSTIRTNGITCIVANPGICIHKKDNRPGNQRAGNGFAKVNPPLLNLLWVMSCMRGVSSNDETSYPRRLQAQNHIARVRADNRDILLTKEEVTALASSVGEMPVRNSRADGNDDTMMPLSRSISSEEQISAKTFMALPQSSLLQSEETDPSIQELLENNLLACGSQQAKVGIIMLASGTQCKNITGTNDAIKEGLTRVSNKSRRQWQNSSSGGTCGLRRKAQVQSIPPLLKLWAIQKPKPRCLLPERRCKNGSKPNISITARVAISSNPRNAVSEFIANVALVARDILGGPSIAEPMFGINEQMAPNPSNVKVSIGIPLSKDLISN
jgi:hypothetical protein